VCLFVHSFMVRDFAASEDLLAADSPFGRLQLSVPRINILGNAEWDVTEQQIKRAYRDLSLRVHPDKCSSSHASAAFHAVKEAYQLLLDERTRATCVSEFATKLKQQPLKSVGWESGGASSGSVAKEKGAEVLQAQGVSAEDIASATAIELEVAVARHDRMQAVARQQAAVGQLENTIVQDMQARRAEQAQAKDEQRQLAQKRLHNRMARRTTSSSSSSGSSDSDASDKDSDDEDGDDEKEVRRRIQALRNKKKGRSTFRS
jgi:hypothetical protein